MIFKKSNLELYGHIAAYEMGINPCPFCGAVCVVEEDPEDTICTKRVYGAGAVGYSVECGWCHAMGPICETECEAVEEWNNARGMEKK